jgi:hypothetical protein
VKKKVSDKKLKHPQIYSVFNADSEYHIIFDAIVIFQIETWWILGVKGINLCLPW